MKTKVCKQCGELRPESMYRKYYGGRKGTYRTCKICEKINARAKYLRNKGDNASTEESTELEKIMALYDAQRKLGLRPPTEQANETVNIMDAVSAQLAKCTDQLVLASVDAGVDEAPAPRELAVWLTNELTEDPEYYLDTVYEQLKAAFRPQLSIDTATMQPIYDDTYKNTLDKILTRFYDYEEAYYAD